MRRKRGRSYERNIAFDEVEELRPLVGPNALSHLPNARNSLVVMLGAAPPSCAWHGHTEPLWRNTLPSKYRNIKISGSPDLRFATSDAFLRCV